MLGVTVAVLVTRLVLQLLEAEAGRLLANAVEAVTLEADTELGEVDTLAEEAGHPGHGGGPEAGRVTSRGGDRHRDQDQGCSHFLHVVSGLCRACVFLILSLSSLQSSHTGKYSSPQTHLTTGGTD